MCFLILKTVSWNITADVNTDKKNIQGIEIPPKALLQTRIVPKVYSTNKVLLKFTYNKIPKSINIDRSGPKIITKDA